MKKIKIMLVVALVCLIFAACGNISEASSSQSTGKTSEPSSSAAAYSDDYQALSKDEYDDLQRRKGEFEALSEEQKQLSLEGGTIGCKRFIHLEWEDTIAVNFILYVGEDKFKAWVKECETNDECTSIYNFADEFEMDFDALKALIAENKLEDFYPLDKLEERYNYFHQISAS